MAKLSNNYNAFWQYVNNLNEILEEKELTFEDLVEIGKAVEGGTYQTALTSGDFININDNGVISTTYTAGDNIQISNEGVISATDTTYTAGDNIQISNEGVISATDTTYTAGSGITINENNEISSTSGSLYMHNILFRACSVSNTYIDFRGIFYSTSSVELTKEEIFNKIIELNGNSAQFNYIQLLGSGTTNVRLLYNLNLNTYSNSPTGSTIKLDGSTYGDEYFYKNNSSNTTATDTITQII